MSYANAVETMRTTTGVNRVINVEGANDDEESIAKIAKKIKNDVTGSD